MEHLPISTHMIHPQAIEVCRILQEHDYQAFIVGGCVRDLLLGQKPKDWDITTDASPKKVMELFEKTIPTGLQHGTITVCMGEGVENHFEVTTFRIEGEYSDGRRPDEVFFVMDVNQDLARRDLTINAIAYDPINHQFADPFNGVKDLSGEGLIKAVGNPSARFKEDGLRIMRVARFAARFGYAVDGHTFQGMKQNLDTLKKVSKERISDELSKTLMSAHPSYGLQILKESGALDIACPLLFGRQLPLLPFQDRCEGPLEVRLAFLYNRLPYEQVQEELIGLKFSNKEIKRVIFLIQLVEKFKAFQDRNTALAYKSFMAVIKNHSPDPWEETLQQFLQLTEAQCIGARSLLGEYSQEVVLTRKEMQLNGNDLMEAGMPAGPRIKKALDECYLEILRNPEHNTKYHLLEHARQY
jgi:tRNA nucleotidyltransferase (CCA-adding enzyme)